MKNIWHYNKLLPAVPENSRLLLGEGNTPLIKAKTIGKMLGLTGLYFKLENLNPTGSYKDRFAAIFVSILKSRNQHLCLATSSGNTGAALAAYCAAAGINCTLAIVDGAPQSKIKQMQLYGAHTYMVKGFGKDAVVTEEVFGLLKRMARAMQIALPVSAFSYCDEGMKGVQTIAYEILEQENSFDHIFCPAGGGGLTLAVARGCIAYGECYPVKIPKVHCVQPEGNDTIAGALRNHRHQANAIAASTTLISGLQVPNVLDGDAVIASCTKLGGTGYIVNDQEVFKWQRLLAQQEGIFCEPAGAVALAGLANAVTGREVSAKDNIVCLVTGSGFKDMLSVDSNFGLPDLQSINISQLESNIRALQ